MKKLASYLILFFLSANLYAQKIPVSVYTEVKKLSRIQDLPKFWEGSEIKQTSSYDTTGNNDDGFSGKYSFVRRNPDSSLIIFDVPGNGVINRIWTPTPTNDTLDFYIGKVTTPTFSIRFSDLFSGKVPPFTAPLTGNELGGFFSYLPIPFNNGCKIILRGKKLEFYQIQYRTYNADYKVEPFKLPLNQTAVNAINELPLDWKNIALNTDKSIKSDLILSPGKSVTLAQVAVGGRITGIKLYPSLAFTGLNKQMDIRITWDNEETPAVYMPVADFFGYAFGKESMQSLLLGSKDQINYCYIPMPFASKAKIELIYRLPRPGISGEPIKIKSEVFFSKQKLNPATEGKFYAFWNRNQNIPAGKPHVFLEGKGKGHYVGTILQAQGLKPGMTLFFEGDDESYIDGKMNLHGTGSEDYFNGGWYALLDRWDRAMSLPLHGSLDYSLPFARTGGFRLFIADKMPFQKQILHTIEHGPEQNNKPADYTSVALYYARKAISKQAVPTNLNTSVYIPDTLMVYPQLMQLTVDGNLRVEGNSMQSSTGGSVRIALNEIPKGIYKLYADLEKTPDGAEISLWQRQKLVSSSISFYSKDRQQSKNTFMCDLIIDDFRNAISLHFKKDISKSIIHIDRLILVRQK
jgi:hypothetical protein